MVELKHEETKQEIQKLTKVKSKNKVMSADLMMVCVILFVVLKFCTDWSWVSCWRTLSVGSLSS